MERAVLVRAVGDLRVAVRDARDCLRILGLSTALACRLWSTLNYGAGTQRNISECTRIHGKELMKTLLLCHLILSLS